MMKRGTLIACGTLAGFLGTVNIAAPAQQQFGGPAWGLRAQDRMAMWPSESTPQQNAEPLDSQTLPRGDLRGDIANNARTRFEPGSRPGPLPVRRHR
jgi:hypothetical protein